MLEKNEYSVAFRCGVLFISISSSSLFIILFKYHMSLKFFFVLSNIEGDVYIAFCYQTKKMVSSVCCRKSQTHVVVSGQKGKRFYSDGA